MMLTAGDLNGLQGAVRSGTQRARLAEASRGRRALVQ
jgi:hypothetical protein